MNNHTKVASFALDPRFQEQERLLVELARAMAAGDEQRADAVRDEIEETATGLSAEQIVRLNDMSGDLYILEGTETFGPAAAPVEAARTLLGDSLAKQSPDEVLKLLRRHGPALERSELAWLRAGSYAALGHYWAALAFADVVSETDGAVVTQFFRARCLVAVGLATEARSLVEQAWPADTYPASERVLAALSAFLVAKAAPDAERAELYRRIVLLIEGALPDGGQPDVPTHLAAQGYLVATLASREQGDISEALRYIGRAIDAEPSIGLAYAVRIALRGNLQDAASLADARRLVDSGFPFPPAYVAVAADALARGEYAECVRVSGAVLQDPAAAVRARALVLHGIGTIRQSGRIEAGMPWLEDAQALLPEDRTLRKIVDEVRRERKDSAGRKQVAQLEAAWARAAVGAMLKESRSTGTGGDYLPNLVALEIDLPPLSLDRAEPRSVVAP